MWMILSVLQLMPSIRCRTWEIKRHSRKTHTTTHHSSRYKYKSTWRNMGNFRWISLRSTVGVVFFSHGESNLLQAFQRTRLHALCGATETRCTRATATNDDEKNPRKSHNISAVRRVSTNDYHKCDLDLGITIQWLAGAAMDYSFVYFVCFSRFFLTLPLSLYQTRRQ